MWWLWIVVGFILGVLTVGLIFIIKIVKLRAGVIVIDHSTDQPEIFLELADASKLKENDVVAFSVEKRDYITHE